MRKQFTAIVIATLLLFSATMFAENIFPETKSIIDSSRVHDIDEIVIIATPKEPFKLRQQPISSSSFSRTDTEKFSAKSLKDLALFVPSFVMPDYGSRLTSAIYVRGIGSRINSPAIGIYVDDMPIMSKSAFNFHTYELSRVDVLRGPQTTLYGQNTEGGLIRMYSLNPIDYQGTNLRMGIGSHFRRNFEVAHYRKINDTFGYSLAAFYEGCNGFLRNHTTLEKADLSNETGSRLHLIYMPTKNFSLGLTADYQFVRQNAFAYGQLDLATGNVAEPSSNYQGSYRRSMANVGLKMKYHSSTYDITSISTYQFLDDKMQMDQDYLPEDYMHLTQSQHQNALTEELTINGTVRSFWKWTFGIFGSYQWLKTIAPVYFDEAITTPIANTIQTSIYNSIVSAMVQRFMATGLSEALARIAAEKAVATAGGISMNISMDVPGTFYTPNFNLGLFHESNFNLSNCLTATIGLRYDHTLTKIEYDTRATMTMTANIMGKTSSYDLLSKLIHKNDDKFHQLLPKIGLTYRLGSDGSNIYALVSKGYRAGGFNIQMFSDILQTELTANRRNAMNGNYEIPHNEEDYENIRKTIAFKPETSWNYEVGTHLNIFNNKLHIDISAFYMNIQNQQLSVMARDYGFGRMMVNAGRSRSLGVEASLRGCGINNHLSWNVSYGLANATFSNYNDSLTINGKKTFVSYEGKRVPYMPLNTLGACIDYRFDFNKAVIESLTTGINLSAQGKTYWDESNTYAQPFYALLGAYINAVFGKTSIKIWSKNMTNTNYNTFAISSSATGEKLIFAQRGWPLSFGMEVLIRL